MAGDFTVGVEEEYQLVCAETGALRSLAPDVLRDHWTEEIRPESQQTILEVGTEICDDINEVQRELRRLRLQVASAAAAQDLSIIAAGVHPFSHWEGQEGTEGERYRRIKERYGRVVRTDHIFGMHVHVAVPDGADRAQLMTLVRQYLPHLLALSASSPIYEADDTGYASYRCILGHRFPLTGPPPQFASDSDYSGFVDALVRAGAIEDEYMLYWSIRRHPEYPTLEFRSTDVCPRLEDAAAIAALIRALVVAAVEGKLVSVHTDGSQSSADALLAQNEWQAARYGLGAMLVQPRAQEGKEPVRDAIQRLIECLLPVAEAAGDDASLAGLQSILERGNGADCIRAKMQQEGDLAEVVRWLTRESLVGVDLDLRSASPEPR